MSEKICVLGLGYIGLPTSLLMAGAGFSVHGVDIRQDVVDGLNSGRLHFSEPGLPEAFAGARENLHFGTEPVEADVFIIAVQTPCLAAEGTDVRHSDLRYVKNAASMVGKVLRPGNLVVLESTVPPETTRLVERICAETSGLSPDAFLTAHCPERVIPGNLLRELRENDRIIGARVPAAAEAAARIYEKIVTGGRIHRTDDMTAELCKLAENTYRDINIAYANELSMLADQLGVDVFPVIALANCHPRVNIHRPGAGVGGHCIALDPWFLQEKQPEGALSLIKTARLQNGAKTVWTAERIAEKLPAGAAVCVLGLAYKPDVDDLRESPGLTLCELLRGKGFSVTACEPHAADADIRGFVNRSLPAVLESGDFLVITQRHKAFFERRDEILSRPHFDCDGFAHG